MSMPLLVEGAWKLQADGPAGLRDVFV